MAADVFAFAAIFSSTFSAFGIIISKSGFIEIKEGFYEAS